MAKIIDGKKISAQVKDECRERVAAEGLNVTLAVIQVGNDPASAVYVGNKKKACEYTGCIPFPMNCRRRLQRRSFLLW